MVSSYVLVSSIQLTKSYHSSRFTSRICPSKAQLSSAWRKDGGQPNLTQAERQPFTETYHRGYSRYPTHLQIWQGKRSITGRVPDVTKISESETRCKFITISVYLHRRRKVKNIGGGQGLEYWGGQGGPNCQQAHDVVLTSMRRPIDVISTSCAH